MAFKIVQDVDICIGCGACVGVCPDNWEMDGDKAKPINKEVDDVGCNREAEEICPVRCIKIEEV